MKTKSVGSNFDTAKKIKMYTIKQKILYLIIKRERNCFVIFFTVQKFSNNDKLLKKLLIQCFGMRTFSQP